MHLVGSVGKSWEADIRYTAGPRVLLCFGREAWFSLVGSVVLLLFMGWDAVQGLPACCRPSDSQGCILSPSTRHGTLHLEGAEHFFEFFG